MIRSQPTTVPRRRVFVAVIVVAAATLVAVGGYLAFGRGSSGSPSTVVRSYLQALARGDARAALALGKVPTDRMLLTAPVLRQQQALGPITAIKIVGSDQGNYGAIVHARYRVGKVAVDNHFEVIPDGRGWTLAHTAVDIQVSGPNLLPSPAVLGQALGPRTEVYVFPGLVTFGSMDGAFTLYPDSAVFTDPDVPTMVSPASGLSRVGRDAATALVRAAMIVCARTRSLAPPNCPQHSPIPPVAGLVANSLRWQAPTDYRGVRFAVDESTAISVRVTGRVNWTLRYRFRPARGARTVPGSVLVPAVLAATIDYGPAPPVYRAG